MRKVISSVIAIVALVALVAPVADAQVVYGSYCCDGVGVRRCVLVNPAPIGSGCFCVGQGAGITCL